MPFGLISDTLNLAKKLKLPLVITKLKKKINKIPTLNKFGINFTNLARQGKLDPCFGRDEELLQLMQILARRQKGNPVLIGDPGVGKSAIIEHFANQLVANLVPFILQGRSIISLDLTHIISGSRFRGQFEGRLQKIIKEVLNNPHIIIFIDEIHILSGAGSVDGGAGSMDAANILKPFLSRGSFQCIGASTPKEYERFEKDPALSRRFQPIFIKEPSIENTIKILYNLRPTLESYHNVFLEPLALKTATELSTRYIQDRYLPDKAIDLIDRVAAKEVIKKTNIEKVSVIRGLINNLLINLEKLRLEAFRSNNIINQYLFQEIKSSYKDFIIKWIENPSSINKLKKKKLSPLSENLLDKLRLLLLQYSNKYLFTYFGSKVKIAKINVLFFVDEQNELIFERIFKPIFLKKSPIISIYRIFLYFYCFRNLNIINSINKIINNYIYNYLKKIKKLFNKKKYFKQDILKIDYNLLQSNYKFNIKNIKKQNQKLKIFNYNLKIFKPLIKKTNLKLLKKVSNLNLSSKEKTFFSTFLNTTSLYNTYKNFETNNLSLKTEITSNHIIELLGEMLNIPIKNVSKEESIELMNLENTLHKKIIGQEEAVSAISKAIRRSRLGLQNLNRPLASFLFCGPTGVGKTEIVKALAYTMFGSEKAIIRFDMSEFMEKHSISRLIGSPPGYIGYDEGGQLTDAVRRTPYSIVLFDEAEKAHPDVLNILLQILEDGRLSDTQKRLISFENTIIILTSNAAAGEIQKFFIKKKTLDSEKVKKTNLNKNFNNKLKSNTYTKDSIKVEMIGNVISLLKSPIINSYNLDLKKKTIPQIINPLSIFEDTLYDSNIINVDSNSQDLKSLVIEKLSTMFLPEFLNRFDDIIVFKPLTIEQLNEIASIMITKLVEKAKLKNINLIVDSNVKAKLTKDAYNPIFGARPLRRLITKNLEDSLSDILLSSINVTKSILNIRFLLDLKKNIIFKIF